MIDYFFLIQYILLLFFCVKNEEYPYYKICLAFLRNKRSQTDRNKSSKFHSSYFREMRFVKREIIFISSDTTDYGLSALGKINKIVHETRLIFDEVVNISNI